MRVRNSSTTERAFNTINYTILALFVILIILPFWYISVVALNEGMDTARGGVYLWPRAWTLDNFRAVFTDLSIIKYFFNSLLRLCLLTPLHLLVIGMAGWALSRKNLPGRKFFAGMFVISMFVNPGVIPFYMTLVQFKLINNFWVYVLPWLFSTWELMILLVSIRQIPESLIESAYLDGANDMVVFSRIIVPLTTATLVTLGLFNAVWAWGDWFTGAFYIRSHDKWTIATYLQMVLQRGASMQIRSAAEASISSQNVAHQVTISETSLRAATLIVVIFPIACVYPFLQKYFIHGVMLGSIKE